VVASLQREDIIIGPSPVDRGIDGGVSTTSPLHDDQLFSLAPGEVAGLTGIPGTGLTRLGLSLIAPYANQGALACIDVRGWMSPAAAWELGIAPERLVIVRSVDIVAWGRIVATLLDGLRGVYAEVPPGVKDASLRKLVARARTKRTPLVLRPLGGDLPRGMAHLSLRAREVIWEGTDAGHGRLRSRRTLLDASGKSTRGMERTIEIEDDGTNDLRVISHVPSGFASLTTMGA
jgi:hypothetical protein